MIPLLKAYLVPSTFIGNVINQVDILLVGVGIEICGSDISQFRNVVENSICWCFHIKSHLFDHILMLGKHMRCNVEISVEEMLVDDI